MSDLPDWEECAAAVVAQTATPLQEFIYDNEPAGPHDEVFRSQLFAILAAARAQALADAVHYLQEYAATIEPVYEKDAATIRVAAMLIEDRVIPNRALATEGGQG